MGAKPMSEFFKFAAEDLEVVDFSVEDNPIACGRIFHRNVPGRGQILNGQSPASQPDAKLDITHLREKFNTLVVRPAMSQRARASHQCFFKLRASFAN